VSGAAGDTRARLERLTALVPFLRWRVGPAEPGELACAALAADPDVVAAAVAGTTAGRGTDDHQVAASLWWQSYVYRVAGTTLGCWLVSGAAPDPAAPRMAIGISRHRPASVVYAEDAPPMADLPALLERLFADHLDPAAAALRARHPLGMALVAGNTGSSVESAVAAVRGAPGAPPLEERVALLRAALPSAVAASVERWPDGVRRRTCCLWWKTTEAAGRLCGDCSLRHRTAATTVPADD
jgi:ferric iron reductase protein FhuF